MSVWKQHVLLLGKWLRKIAPCLQSRVREEENVFIEYHERTWSETRRNHRNWNCNISKNSSLWKLLRFKYTSGSELICILEVRGFNNREESEIQMFSYSFIREFTRITSMQIRVSEEVFLKVGW